MKIETLSKYIRYALQTGDEKAHIKATITAYENWDIIEAIPSEKLRENVKSRVAMVVSKTPVTYIPLHVQLKIAQTTPNAYMDLLGVLSASISFRHHSPEETRKRFKQRLRADRPTPYLIYGKALKIAMRTQDYYKRRALVKYLQLLKDFEQHTGKKWRE